jgi:uncharacterized membrane protein YphA (DoxX/SURF4 family)
MPSVFPELFNYSQVAPLLLRTLLAVILLASFPEEITREIFKYAKILKAGGLVCALILLAGLFTQVAAILTIIIVCTERIILKKRKIETGQKSLWLIISIIALSLIFSGPGLYALDLPL